MTLDLQDKKTLSELRFEKAREAIEDARANFKGARFMTTVNRSYYAALNAARSLLILEGVNHETNTGTITTLSLRFIKTGILPVETVKNIKLLLSRRTDVDYGDFEFIGAEEAEDSLVKAEATLRCIDEARKRMIADLTG